MGLNKIGIFQPSFATTQLKTCLFTPHGDTWSFFADNYTSNQRETILKQLASWGMNGMISLLSNTDERCPVSFFDVWGGNPYWQKIEVLEKYARLIYTKGAMFIPCIFCDDGENHRIQFAPNECHERSISLLLAVLYPFIPAILIGLESSEYFNKEKHEYFIGLIKHCAPHIYVGTHLQKEPEGGMPADLDFIAYEHSWSPVEGDNHSAEEVVREVREVSNRWGKPILPVEYNVHYDSSRMREQSKALLQAGFGCGGAYF